MARLVLPILILVHGSIHLIGVISAFKPNSFVVNQAVSKSVGLVWMLVLLMFVISALLLIAGRDWWLIGIAAVLVSQILIVGNWHEAKFGTIANMVILVAGIINIAHWQFYRTAKNEVEILMATPGSEPSYISADQLEKLPVPVKKWLNRSGAASQRIPTFVRLRQNGELRTSRKSKWMNMRADQYFRTDQPSFVWTANINYATTHISGKDDFLDGKGHMLIKIASLIKVADASGPETDQGTMLRYLAEIQWFPSAAVRPYISWESNSPTSAIATMTYKGLTVKGTFFFTKDGDIAAFEAQRYMEDRGKYHLETWYVPVTDYGVFEGVRVPVQGQAIWKLKDGDFNWFNWQVTDIDYNMTTTYQ